MSRLLLCALVPVVLAATPVAADDFGFAELASAIRTSTSDGSALLPFLERPAAVDVGFSTPNAFGYLGSVTSPKVAFPSGNSTVKYYRADSANKCNPDQYTFPAGQGGIQKISYASSFKFELKAGEITLKGGSKADTVFSLSALNAKILRKVKITITDIREYTLDYRLLKRRVQQVAADPDCAQFKQALTKVVEGKVLATYYFEAGAESTAQLDLANTLNAKIGLSVISQSGGGEADPNVLQFESSPLMIAATFRPVSELVGPRPVRRVAQQ